MRRSIPLLAGLLAAAPVAAHAQRLAPIKGGRLLGLCENGRTRVACDAYISGVAAGLAGGGPKIRRGPGARVAGGPGVEHMMSREQGKTCAGATCIPAPTSADALRSTVVDFLHAHAEDGDKPAAVPTFEALHAAYPCKGNG